ncbi:MAG: family 43 glycosylhydrolase, partial [Bacteroidaceae bacterium]|nr:family 43 glycosylhydrolase [Bacteroidaceae bacterium]
MNRFLCVLSCVALVACAPSAHQAGEKEPVHHELCGNPIITNMYSADPSAHVFGDSLYIYPSHDEDRAVGFDMKDYHVYVTADMQNFEDKGVIFRPFEQTTWAKSAAWAPDCVERNGKYYLYFPTDQKHIGVAVSD